MNNCADANLKRLCSEYADTLPCCSAIATAKAPFRERAKVLWGRADCLDLFVLKDQLLKSDNLKIKASGLCMYPALKKGDILKITPAKANNLEIGDIPVYRSRDRLYAHRVVDKQVINGEQFIITRADTARVAGDNKTGQAVPEKDILGKIKEIERGEKIFSPHRKPATAGEEFFYKTAKVRKTLTGLIERLFQAALIQAQSLRLYAALGKIITVKLKRQFSFELAVPFSNPGLNRAYRYIRLADNQTIDCPDFKKAQNFHLVMKINNRPIGCLSFLNRPQPCPYPGVWLSDAYVRWRYRKLGLEAILKSRAEQFLKGRKVNNAPALSG
ncbi:GNAT family N-acetyltransferase [Candidatus Omnitrophota bacterium]